MARTRGGKKRIFTNLEIRRRLWDAMDELRQKGTKRPGSNKK